MQPAHPEIDATIERAIVFSKRLWFVTTQPVLEILFGIRFETLPWLYCLAPGALFNVLVICKLDIWIWRLVRVAFIYPTSHRGFLIYAILGATSGFWNWGLGQTFLKQKLTKRLTDTFIAAGLRTPLGKFPAFVFDRPIDAMTRKLRLKRNHLSQSDFIKARPVLESSLQIFIDTIQENREQGSVDIVYSHFKMPEIVTLGESLTNLPRDTFVVGMSRAQQMLANLSRTPHFLVGGQTGGGKSTFLRQLITTLYLNNKDYQFRLIDLKGGLEFQIFENVSRIKVVPDVPKAIRLIGTLEKSLNYRFETLKMNGCKDIVAFFAKPITERKYPKGQYREAISRTIVVIDEVADLFMANVDLKEVQHAKRSLSKVGAQGRAVGLHLIVATQRPDVRALDSQVKTHLVGVICFAMANDASSITVLGNGRATDLPVIPGRAIWKSNMDMVELQTPFLSTEEVLEILPTQDPAIKMEDEANEKTIEGSRDVNAEISVEVEGRNDDSPRD
jgi:ABC-type ATPase involved in cell division